MGLKEDITNEIIENIEQMARNKKTRLFRNLIKSNSGISSKNFFLVMTTLIGSFMLLVLVIGMFVDIVYNHTVTLDMSSAAAYIGAISTLFASAGITKAWSDSSANKYLSQHPENLKESSTVEDEEDEYIVPQEE